MEDDDVKFDFDKAWKLLFDDEEKWLEKLSDRLDDVGEEYWVEVHLAAFKAATMMLHFYCETQKDRESMERLLNATVRGMLRFGDGDKPVNPDGTPHDVSDWLFPPKPDG